MPDREMTEQERAAVISTLLKLTEDHINCRLEQVGPCVWCIDHNMRLYQGRLPADRNPGLAVCEREGHQWDDADSMCQSGFYYLCTRCGEQEWTE